MKAPVDVTTRQRLFDAYTNRFAIIEHMETHNDEVESPYRQRIETLMTTLLAGDGDADDGAEAQALPRISGRHDARGCRPTRGLRARRRVCRAAVARADCGRRRCAMSAIGRDDRETLRLLSLDLLGIRERADLLETILHAGELGSSADEEINLQRLAAPLATVASDISRVAEAAGDTLSRLSFQKRPRRRPPTTSEPPNPTSTPTDDSASRVLRAVKTGGVQ
jgi:hypothetical protein